jgi:2-succinyl-5-enolpyruvyl-6-hydroxy-3-cyclohexene-1-carboxylate synthase
MASPRLDFRNVNALWCSVLAETLHHCGVRHAVISPGSRSTPLAFAFAAHAGIEATPVLDERSAGFFALGIAKRTRVPTVLVCTSGTAAANFLPAVIEAHESGVPLLVLTADRPPELRFCGAGQTIDQQKLYGDRVNHFQEIAVPEARLDMLGYLRQAAAHACARTLVARPGPVHLNFPFRDPLPPISDGLRQEEFSSQLGESFFSHLAPTSKAEIRPVVVPQLPATRRGLVLAGPMEDQEPEGYAAACIGVAEKLGWPLLADALSPVRSNVPPGASVITAYDAILRSPAIAAALKPQAVLLLEGYPTSKVLREWLAGIPELIVLRAAEDFANRDPLHAATRELRCGVRTLVGLVSGEKRQKDPYAARWVELESIARTNLDQKVERLDSWFEGSVARLLQESLPGKTPLFIANSMPVRDVEYFFGAKTKGPRVTFNRGANGIDGTLSTALGIAHGGMPAVLLTGDLALLHDSNGFLIHPKLRGSLTIVLINNQGGGIFEHLPVSRFDPPFEEFVAMPQSVDFSRLAAAHGVEHRLMADVGELASALRKLPDSGVRILEVRTDRKMDAATRKRLFSEVSALLA